MGRDQIEDDPIRCGHYGGDVDAAGDHRISRGTGYRHSAMCADRHITFGPRLSHGGQVERGSGFNAGTDHHVGVIDVDTLLLVDRQRH